MTGYGAAIFAQHAGQLAGSAIGEDVAAERGYVSVDTKRRLDSAGFKHYQQRVPGLLIPVHDISGAIETHQYRPDRPRETGNGKPVKYETPGGSRMVLDVPPRIRPQLGDPNVPLWITEGIKKADAAVSAGLCCVALLGVWNWKGTNTLGGRTALPEFHDIAWNDGRRVYVAYDSDVMTNPRVHSALVDIGLYIASRGADVRYVYLPADGDAKVGLDDYLAVGGSVDALITSATPRPREVARRSPHTVRTGDPNISGKPPEKAAPDVPPMTIAQVEATYAKWLHDGDKVTTRVVHAAYVANMALAGDPVWVMLVGGSGTGKTERLAPLAVMPPVVLVSAISGEAALLSATPRKDRAEHAHGGLLRRVGDKGVLVLKDFTTVLEMDRTDRGKVLAAFREIYDGRWDRDVGTDGGQTLTWRGKCGFLAGCTGAIDRAHAVVNDMGPRSLFLRLPPADLDAIGASALDHMGQEDKMRGELAAATAGLLTHLPGRPHEVTSDIKAGLIGLSNLVSQGRSPVQRDWKGEIELVLDAEAPTRIIKQLGQLWRACGVLGLGAADSWEVIRRCALDSIPKLRGAVIRCLDGQGTADTTTVGNGVVHPTRTVRRALEDLTAHGVVSRIVASRGNADSWKLSDRARAWLAAGDTLPEMLGLAMCTVCGGPLAPALIKAGYTTHGEDETP
jgi:uncharacterized protein DUF3854